MNNRRSTAKARGHSEAQPSQHLPTQSWPAPLPLCAHEPPELDVDSVFPKTLDAVRQYVVAIAEAFQVPVELPALLALPIISTAAAQKYLVSVTDDWTEQAALWSLVLLPSGARKSPVVDELLRPILSWQDRERERLRVHVLRAQAQLDVLYTKIRCLKRRIASSEPDEADDAQRELDELLSTPAPGPTSFPRIVTSEATTEAIALQLAENEERALIAAAESDAFEVLLGRYGKANLGLPLAAYSGEPFGIDRVGREPIHLRRPALSIAIATQPSAALSILRDPRAHGRGLLARLLVAMPKSSVGFRNISPPAVPRDFREDFRRRIVRLLDEPLMTDIGVGPTNVSLNEEARRLFWDYRTEHEQRMRADGDLADHVEWASKLPGNLVRIALALHVLQDQRDDSISLDTMSAALAWEGYLVESQRHVFGSSWNADVQTTERVLAWIVRTERRSFSRRDAFTELRCSTLSKVADLDSALDLLEDRGHIRRQPGGPGRRGRPSVSYEVNPCVWSGRLRSVS